MTNINSPDKVHRSVTNVNPSNEVYNKCKYLDKVHKNINTVVEEVLNYQIMYIIVSQMSIPQSCSLKL